MNRKERRKMSKKLGIMQYQQKLSRNKKFDLIRENIILGKKMQNEAQEEIRQQDNKFTDQKESEIIFHIAEDIAKRKQIPIIDAMEEAKKEYYQ